MIQKEQVIAAQNEWGSGVVAIGALRDKRAECEAFASNFLDKMYAFDLGTRGGQTNQVLGIEEYACNER